MKYIFFFISLLLHLSFFTFISPTIDKKSMPVIVSWLDILSSSDLIGKKKENKINNHKIYNWFSMAKSENYFFKKNSVVLFRDYFSSICAPPLSLSMKKAIEEKDKKFSKKLNYPNYFLLFLKKPSFLEKENLNLKYKINTDKEGKILFFIPQVLNSDLMLLYANAHLRHNFLFLKKRNLFWTKIKIVIK